MPPIEPGVSHELAKWRASRYSDVRYKLSLTLEKMSPVLKGTIEIRLEHSIMTCDAECPAMAIVLDWRRIKGSESLSTISNVTLNGRSAALLARDEQSRGSGSFRKRDASGKVIEDISPIKYAERDEHLMFEEGVQVGENVIKLDFTSPILTSGSAITRYIDKEDGSEYIYSLFVPSDASTAFPVFDQPDLKARFTLTTTVPWGYGTAVSNTAPFIQSFGGGRDIFEFEETKPISTYVFAFAAGPWERVSAGSEPGTTVTGASTRTNLQNNQQQKTPVTVVPGSDMTAVSASSKSPPAIAVVTDSPQSAAISSTAASLARGSEPGAVATGSQSTVRVDSAGGKNPVAIAPGSDNSFTDDGYCGELGTLVTADKIKGRLLSPDIQALNLLTVPRVGEAGTPSIYVRKSQLKKLQPHAAEVFRLNREGIKFLESYFDYKFPFPKYDIVLIPEFPFGGMEHAGATFLRESSVIFPQAPTKNDYISRANVIFHEAAHQWFGDTVTMKWFDDLWLKEGFAEFMAYKTLEKVMPEYNAWKVFYERNKQAAYLTDSTKGTTPIYQEIANLNSAKSAYGNIVYRKAPSFLKQAEFYLGPDKFQTAVRAFLKKHEYANARWEDLVTQFQATTWGESRETDSLSSEVEIQRTLSGQVDRRDIKDWATIWVNRPGLPILKATEGKRSVDIFTGESYTETTCCHLVQQNSTHEAAWPFRTQVLVRTAGQDRVFSIIEYPGMSALAAPSEITSTAPGKKPKSRKEPEFFFGNYQDYGYGIFLLDSKSRDYVLKNIQNEKDDFLRTMMWGSLWDSVREGELDPREYVELVVKNLKVETDESTIQTLLGRVSTAMRYYIEPEPPALAGGFPDAPGPRKTKGKDQAASRSRRPTDNDGVKNPPANAGGSTLSSRVENLLVDRMQNAATPGQKITYYRAFLNIASSENARRILKQILKGSEPGTTVTGALNSTKVPANAKLKTPVTLVPGSDSSKSVTTKDKFDIVSRLIVLGDPEASKLLADLEKSETTDEAKRYAYAAKAGFATAENKAMFWNDFVNNKEISESWIEAAFGPFNNVAQGELTLQYLEKALAELPNLKRNRKIFFVNGWLGAFIGGQRSEQALAIVNKFLADSPNLDRDLRLKILENVDVIERAVKIRGRFGRSS